MKYNQDKSAFPSDETDFEGREYGLTKREYFAAMAMQALVSNHSINTSHCTLAREAVSAADALLEELEK